MKSPVDVADRFSGKHICIEADGRALDLFPPSYLTLTNAAIVFNSTSLVAHCTYIPF